MARPIHLSGDETPRGTRCAMPVVGVVTPISISQLVLALFFIALFHFETTTIGFAARVRNRCSGGVGLIVTGQLCAIVEHAPKGCHFYQVVRLRHGRIHDHASVYRRVHVARDFAIAFRSLGSQPIMSSSQLLNRSFNLLSPSFILSLALASCFIKVLSLNSHPPWRQNVALQPCPQSVFPFLSN